MSPGLDKAMPLGPYYPPLDLAKEYKPPGCPVKMSG